MNIATVLLAPLVLLLPAAGAIEQTAYDGDDAAGAVLSSPVVTRSGGDWGLQESERSDEVLGPRKLADAANPQDAWQIRIEQRVQIRIAPRQIAPMPPPDALLGAPRPPAPRMTERKIGKCLPIAGIVGVDPDRQNTLLLMMRDHRLLSAELERSCRARDFYSGFYLARTKDGMLCVDRDTLLSRSGANCKLTRLRELVEDVDH